jgi:tetratricopeptide (TPR) repeat protein
VGKFITLVIHLLVLGCSFNRGNHIASKSHQSIKSEDCYKILTSELSKVDKNSYKIFNQMGNCLGQAGLYGESLYYFEIALSNAELSGPVRSTLFCNMSNIYFATENIDLGITMLDEALKADPQNQTASVRLGKVHFLNGNFNTSIRHFLRVESPTMEIGSYLAASYFFSKNSKLLNNVIKKMTDENSDDYRLLINANEFLSNGSSKKLLDGTKILNIKNPALKLVQDYISTNYEKSSLSP